MSGMPCDIMVCDSMVRKYLPSMRAEMVYRLVQNQGISQSDAAKRLGISRAAISQYMSKKRGDSGIEISDELNAVIDRWTLAVLGQETNITLCDVCRCAMKKT
jgi:predicted transcriptional regulator